MIIVWKFHVSIHTYMHACIIHVLPVQTRVSMFIFSKHLVFLYDEKFQRSSSCFEIYRACLSPTRLPVPFWVQLSALSLAF